jgi:hypothetical protein
LQQLFGKFRQSIDTPPLAALNFSGDVNPSDLLLVCMGEFLERLNGISEGLRKVV